MGKQFCKIDWKSIYPEEPECVKNAIAEAIKQIDYSECIISIDAPGKKRKVPLKKMILIVAVLSMFSGMTVFAASNLWKQRMEEMSQKELTDHYMEVQSSSIFRYNRNLSEEELGRIDILKKEYEEQGHFPKGELKYVSIDEYDGLGIGFDVEKGVFCLPQEELADEEILELIDFQEKINYSLVEINQQIEEGFIEQDVLMPDAGQKEIGTMADFESYNDLFSYRIINSHSEDEYMFFSADNQYLYLGSRYQIERCLHGEEVGDVFYKADAGERIFAIYADDTGNVYVSLASDTDMSGQNKRLIRLNGEGTVECEYGFDQVTSDAGETLCHYFAYKMTVAEDGTLYLKFRGFSDDNVLAYVFDKQGIYKGRVESKDYSVSDWGAMCVGQDGYLYMLGQNKNSNQAELLKVDTDTLLVEEAVELIGTDVTVLFDDMQQINDSEFILTGYDGVCIADANAGDVQCAVHGYDEKWFDEGAKFTCIDENNLVILKRGMDDKSGVTKDAKFIYLRRK